ncbi:hypothetical protein BUALT_Bualt12G0111200 [Buddleja alternifolia]|uniref:Jacalin-type lectin domain-containing protein n=1 Tax=Buddleja alternifolia TaxID=168488 RepID=A0AAV6X117_9LAMI|nr:hypothetical protein BUALT_Bualt12G0111200 [Buddleja alternifolia]
MDNSSFIKIGSGGNKNGKVWDERGKNTIVQIFIWHNEKINSIQFQYAENGTLVLSGRHGSTSYDTPKFDVVELNYPSEYITWISGHTGSTTSYYSDDRLCSITFGTNHGQYGPFGRFNSSGFGRSNSFDKEFTFRLGGNCHCQFGGFYGTSDGNAVTSIGVYLKPNTTLNHSLHKSTVKPKKEKEAA